MHVADPPAMASLVNRTSQERSSTLSLLVGGGPESKAVHPVNSWPVESRHSSHTCPSLELRPSISTTAIRKRAIYFAGLAIENKSMLKC